MIKGDAPKVLVTNCGSSSSIKYGLFAMGAGHLLEVSEIGHSGHAVRALAVRTNEELQIARETLSVLSEPKKIS